MTSLSTDHPDAPSGIFGIHASYNDQPLMRGWAKNEAAAQKLIAELQRTDGNSSDTKYWWMPMSNHELSIWRNAGVIGANAEDPSVESDFV